MNSHLKSLTDDLFNQIDEPRIVLNYQHFVLLKNLPPIEKEMIAKTVSEWSWNVGSVNLMKFLQKSNVLSMTDMILFAHNQDPECAQLIMTDLLEMEHILLADLIKNLNCTDSISLTISDILVEGFKRMCKDLIDDPNILKTNYLQHIEAHLHADDIEDIRLIHLKQLLNQSPTHTPIESIVNQSSWNAEFLSDSPIFNSFLESIIGHNYQIRHKTLKFLLSEWVGRKFRSWKYSLLLFRKLICDKSFSLDEQNELKAIMKKFFKDIFQKSVTAENSDQFCVMLLVARQITQFNEAILSNYTTWFKDNIGEMKYVLKTEEFIKSMEYLTELIEFESDTNILNIQLNTYVPAPLRCNEIVLNYKQLCRSRVRQLEKKPEPVITLEKAEEMDLVLIDESD